jgi:hypothetical protein
MSDVYLRPRMILDRFSRLHPDVWKQVDDLRANHRNRAQWPDWCYLPLSAACYIASRGGTTEQPDQRNLAIMMGALATWRVTQGIYRFDPSTFDAICKTPITGEIPTEVLHYLPEWCVYIPTPGLTWKGASLHGFFAHLEYNAKDRGTQLRFALDFSAQPGEIMFGFPIQLGLGGVAEAVNDMFEDSVRRLPGSVIMLESDMETIKRDIPPLVSLVLYLCCQSAEIKDGQGEGNVPARPQPVKTKRGVRAFPPDRPKQWLVGYRLGAALRRALSDRDAAETCGSHASPRPHIRRAHWHSYWVGKCVEPEARVVILKWLPPIPVNVQSVEELTTTIRDVSHL